MIRSSFKAVLARFGLGPIREGEIPVTTRQISNIIFYSDMYRRVAAVEGAVVECGVGKGRSFLYLNHFASKEGKNRRVWGFDSFEGFPEPTQEDDSLRKPKKGDWGDANQLHIRSVLKAAGITDSWVTQHVRLEKGFFKDSLSRYDGAPIALLHVDADLYESYMDVLTALFPLVVSNGVVMFDEYDEPKWPGAKKAVDEYFAKTPYRVQRHESGKHFLVKSA